MAKPKKSADSHSGWGGGRRGHYYVLNDFCVRSAHSVKYPWETLLHCNSWCYNNENRVKLIATHSGATRKWGKKTSAPPLPSYLQNLTRNASV